MGGNRANTTLPRHTGDDSQDGGCGMEAESWWDSETVSLRRLKCWSASHVRIVLLPFVFVTSQGIKSEWGAAVMASKKQANVLSHKQSFTVMTWMKDHVADIEAWKGTTRDLSEMIAKKTGIDVTDNNIKSLADACGVKLPISHGNQANYIYATLLRRVDELDARLQKLLDSLGVDLK